MLGCAAVSIPSAHAASIPPAPCDIYASANTPCVAAYSTTRVLYASYTGSLYQVQRASDNETVNVGVLSDGYANAAIQDEFCASSTCIITKIYDQSPEHNDLSVAGAGGNGGADTGAIANVLQVTAGGHQVYGVYLSEGMGYRNNATSGVAENGEPEGMYMVTDGTHVNSNCCFDFGNAETNSEDNGNAHMDALYYGTFHCPEGERCTGTGPWVEADLENGLFQSDVAAAAVSDAGTGPLPFVTALLKNDGQENYALKWGNAQTGTLQTNWSGSLPNGYAPMHQEGAVVLGIGGDDSNTAEGSFFEGVMTAGFPSDTADNAVQANIVTVGYATSLADVADSFVRDGSYASENFGSSSELEVKNDITGYNRVSYLKFDLPGRATPITTATLYLTPTTESEAGINNSVYLVPDNTWTESGITWNTAPSYNTPEIASGTLPAVDSPLVFDVTEQVQTAQANGGVISFAVAQPTTQGSNGGAIYASKENATSTYRPVLAIQTSLPN